MKITSLAPVTTLFLASFFLISCGDRAGKVNAKNHTQVADGVTSIVTEMMTEMTGVKDLAAAESFGEKVPDWMAQLSGYLEAAQSLPAPSEVEKGDFITRMDQVNQQAGPGMMAMMMSTPQSPEGQAMAEIIGDAKKDMEKAVAAITAIYKAP